MTDEKIPAQSLYRENLSDYVRMVGVVGGAHVLHLHLDVHLGGGDVGVAEHLLDGVDVGAVLDEMGSEGMTEGVRGYVRLDSGIFGVAF